MTEQQKGGQFTSYWWKLDHGDIDGLVFMFTAYISIIAAGVLILSSAGFPISQVTSQFIAGSAITVLIGSAWLSWIAHRGAKRSGRPDVTAIPYGLNITQLVVYAVAIMLPTFFTTHDPLAAWAIGAASVVWTGIFKIALAPFMSILRKHIPSTSMYAVMAAAMYTYLMMIFFLRLFDNAYVGILALLIFLMGTFGHVPFGKGRWSIPVFVVAWVVPAILGFIVGYLPLKSFWTAFSTVGWQPQLPFTISLAPVQALISAIPYFSIIIPMVVYHVLQNMAAVEAASHVGDVCDVREVLLADGIATLLGGLGGSVIAGITFAMHPSVKALNARIGYQFWSGVLFFGVVAAGLILPFTSVYPFPIAAASVAFSATMVGVAALSFSPKNYHPALLVSFIIPIASVVSSILTPALNATGVHLTADLLEKLNGAIYYNAIQAMSNGFLCLTLIVSAIMVMLIDKKFGQAAIWCIIAAIFSWIGLMHSPYFGWAEAPDFAYAWIIGAAACYSGALLSPKASTAQTQAVKPPQPHEASPKPITKPVKAQLNKQDK